MAVQTTTTRISYTGNGVAKTFSIPFSFLEPAHLRVERINPVGVSTLLVLGTDYTVGGGAVTLPIALTFGWTLQITRITPRIQPIDFREQGDFSPETHEQAFDRAAMIAQEINDGIAVVPLVEHGNLPGGSLHALATAAAAGFLSPGLFTQINNHLGSGGGHSVEQITGLDLALAGKQPVGSYSLEGHAHLIGDVGGLQASLDSISTDQASHEDRIAALEGITFGPTGRATLAWSGAEWKINPGFGCFAGSCKSTTPGVIDIDFTDDLGTDYTVEASPLHDETGEVRATVQKWGAKLTVRIRNGAGALTDFGGCDLVVWA